MMNHLKSLDVKPEDVFREAVYMLDFLLYTQDITQRMVDGLWTLLVNDIREWKADVPDEDKILVAGTVFFIVRDVLCHHFELRYSEDISNMLTVTIERKWKGCNEEITYTIFERLDECSRQLSDWIKSYDEEEEWLSDEIEAFLRKRKTEKLHTNVIVKNDDYMRYSFSITWPPKYKGKENQILGWLHDELVEKHFIEDFSSIDLGKDLDQITNIDEKNRIIFNAVFSGADTDYHIVWIGKKVELRYFVNQLVERNVLTWKKGPRKWQIVRNRIWYRREDKETSEATGWRNTKYTYVQFGIHDLDKGNNPTDTTLLDNILDIIALPTNLMPKQDIGREIQQSFDDNADYELTVPNSRGSKIGTGYRDVSHKAYNGD